MPKLLYCVYVLLSLKDGKFYIGFTTNLKQRLTDHFHGQSKATFPRRPFKLIFCEYFLSKKDAMRRERYFKTSYGKKALKIMLREGLKIKKLAQESKSGGRKGDYPRRSWLIKQGFTGLILVI